MNGRGCPSCARSGFDPAKPGVVYLLQKRDTRGRLILKVGISNVPRQRHAILAKDGWTVRDVSPMIHGQAARDLEQMVLAHLDSRGIPRGSRAFPVPFDGYTESWHAQAFRPRTVPDLVRVVGGHLPEVEAEAA